jgi:hypothetical protein
VFAKDHVVGQKVQEYRNVLDQYFAGLLMKHAKVKFNGDKVEFEFNRDAFNAELNSNSKIRWIIGFVNHFAPGSLDFIQQNSNGAFAVTNPQKYYDFLMKQDKLELSYRKEDGSVEKKVFRTVITEQKQAILQKYNEQTESLAKGRRIIEIEEARGNDTYNMDDYDRDLESGLINQQGEILPQNERIRAVVNTIKTEAAIKAAELMLINLDGGTKLIPVPGRGSVEIGDFFDGITIISGLIKDKKINREKWLAAHKPEQRARLEQGLALAGKVIELRKGMGELKKQIAALEPAVEKQLKAGQTNSPELAQYAGLLSKLLEQVKGLEQHYQAVGYNETAITALRNFRNKIESLISA